MNMQAIYAIIDINSVKHRLGARQIAVAARVLISNTFITFSFSFRLRCKVNFLDQWKVIFLYATLNM